MVVYIVAATRACGWLFERFWAAPCLVNGWLRLQNNLGLHARTSVVRDTFVFRAATTWVGF